MHVDTSKSALALLLLVSACTVGKSPTNEASGNVSPDAVSPEAADNAADDPNLGGCYPGGTLDEYALCLCKDFGKVGTLTTLEGPGGIPSSVGVNGSSAAVDNAHVEGSWAAYGGFAAVTSSFIAQDLTTIADVTWVGDLSIGRDLSVGGNLLGVGSLSVGGSLNAATKGIIAGAQKVAAVGSYAAPAGPPCACDGASFFDVVAAVEDAKTTNDNGALDLPYDIAKVGATQLELPSGRYYFDDLASVGDLHFDILGKVAIFVGSSVAAVGSDQFTLEDGASLDLYIAGSLANVGTLKVGDEGKPVRIFVGGPNAVMLHVGDQAFYGQIYAPTAPIAYVGTTLVEGSLFARELAGVGELIVRHGGAIETPPETCIPDDDGGSDDPAPPGGSTSVPK